jgi:hypothetical protein
MENPTADAKTGPVVVGQPTENQETDATIDALVVTSKPDVLLQALQNAPKQYDDSVIQLSGELFYRMGDDSPTSIPFEGPEDRYST